jgi:hypothetical protein
MDRDNKMSAGYVGYYRMPVWMGLFCIFFAVHCAWTAYGITQPDIYADMLAHNHGRYRWVLEMPRPLTFLLFAFGCLFFGVPFLGIAYATLHERPSFEIDFAGIKRYGNLGFKDHFLAWDQIAEAKKINNGLLFSGNSPHGRAVKLNIIMMGHKANEVVDAICFYRPDLRADIQ